MVTTPINARHHSCACGSLVSLKRLGRLSQKKLHGRRQILGRIAAQDWLGKRLRKRLLICGNGFNLIPINSKDMKFKTTFNIIWTIGQAIPPLVERWTSRYSQLSPNLIRSIQPGIGCPSELHSFLNQTTCKHQDPTGSGWSHQFSWWLLVISVLGSWWIHNLSEPTMLGLGTR